MTDEKKKESASNAIKRDILQGFVEKTNNSNDRETRIGSCFKLRCPTSERKSAIANDKSNDKWH
jgi:hypothetical protein